MKDTKYRLMDAYLYDYPHIEGFLTKQAANGWHLEKIGNLLWKFRRGEPKTVRYEVTYSPAASAYNARPTDEEEDLAALCAQAGWVRVAAAAQLQVFRNDDIHATPLETDENLRLRNIRKTMNRHFFPQYLLLVLLFLLQFYFHCRNLLRWPAFSLSSPLVVSTLSMLPIVSLIYLVMCANGLLWLRRAQREVDRGETIPVNRFYRWFRWVIWAGLIAYLGSLLSMAGLTFAWGILLISAIIIACLIGCINLCKALNAPKWVTFAAPVLVLCVVVSLLMNLFIINLDRTALEKEPPHPESLPLMLSDLGGSENAVHTIMEEASSPLAAYGRYWDDAGEERLSYTIVDIRCPWFYDMIQAEQERNFQLNAHYQGIDDRNLGHLWGAEYARRAPGEEYDLWLICWDSRVVTLKTTWLMTDAQLAQAASLLQP